MLAANCTCKVCFSLEMKQLRRGAWVSGRTASERSGLGCGAAQRSLNGRVCFEVEWELESERCK